MFKKFKKWVENYASKYPIEKVFYRKVEVRK